MGDTRSSAISCADWLVKGPLAPHVDAFKQYLSDRGYAATAFANCVGSIAHFAQWVHCRRLRVQRIGEAAVAEFLDEHLPCCRCNGPVQRDRRGLSAALGHLLVVLRAQGVITPPAVSTSPVDDELRRYDEHMDHVRDLASKTRDIALPIVRRLLTSRFGDAAVDMAAIKPEHVRRFFAQQAKLYSKPASAGSVVAVLRGYFHSEKLAEAQRGIGSSSALALNNFIDAPRRDSDRSCESILADVHPFEKVLRQHHARMHRRKLAFGPVGLLRAQAALPRSPFSASNRFPDGMRSESIRVARAC